MKSGDSVKEREAEAGLLVAAAVGAVVVDPAAVEEVPRTNLSPALLVVPQVEQAALTEPQAEVSRPFLKASCLLDARQAAVAVSKFMEPGESAYGGNEDGEQCTWHL